MADEKLKVILTAENLTKRAFSDVEGAITKLGRASVDVAKKMSLVGAAVGGFAVNEARKFEKSVSNINTLFDDNGEAAQKMAGGLKEILKNTPVHPDELGAAAYNVVSAGITDTAEALSVLENSSKLAVAGLGTTEEAVNIATSAINAFGLEGESATRAFDILQLTVKSGKTNIADLARSFGNVAGVANTAGISFEELQAATAALTTTGQTASIAQTQLRAAILAIQAPTEQMKELLESAGIESGQLALKNEGLVATMQNISQAADGDADALKKAFGSVEALGAALSLTGEQGEAFDTIMNQMENSSGVLDAAFQKQKDTFDSNYQTLKNNLTVILIDLGNAIIPTLNRAISSLLEWWERHREQVINTAKVVRDALVAAFEALRAVLEGVVYWTRQTIEYLKEHEHIAVGVAAALTTGLIVALAALAKVIVVSVVPAFAAMTLAAAPWIIGGAVIAGIVAGVSWIISNWEMLKNKAVEIFGRIGDFLTGAWERYVDIWDTGLTAISEAWNAAWDAIFEYFKGIAEAIQDFFSGIIDGLLEKIEWLVGKITGAVNAVKNVTKKIGGGLKSGASTVAGIAGFAQGGSFTVGGGGGTDSQLVQFMATPGERVSVETPGQQRGGRGLTVNVHVAGSVVTMRELTDQIDRVIFDRLSTQYT